MEPYDKSFDAHIGGILTDIEKVFGEIYLVTNNITGKQYVGQTRTHRENHKKYRPFGYLKRFDDHCSNAKCKSKGKLTYFHNALRKYGIENFEIQLVVRCKLESLDDVETHYVKRFGTLYPNGYNLTTGGKKPYINLRTITPDLYEPIKSKSIKKSEETKDKISQALKKVHDNPEMRLLYSEKAIDQHMIIRKKLFESIKIDKNDIEQYLHLINSKENGQFYRIIIGGVRTSFVSKFASIDKLKEQAINFLNSL